MKLSDIFEEHGIARVSVWTEGGELSSVVSDGPDLQPLFLSDEVCLELEKCVLEFINWNHCYYHTILEFPRSKGVVYIKDGEPCYCGEVEMKEEMVPFSEHWISEQELELMIYSSK